MIARYTRPEMGRVWSDENKFQRWLDVELAATETLAEAGTVPREAAATLRERARVNVARINEIESRVRHDVIAFTVAVQETVGDPEAARWLHYGLTSNDVVDTAQALLIRDASKLMEEGIEKLGDVLERRAWEFKDTPRDWPHSWNTRRADHLWAEDRELVRREPAGCRAFPDRSPAVGGGKDLRRGGKLHASRTGDRGKNLPQARTGDCADQLAGDRARQARAISGNTCDRGGLARAHRPGDPALAAHGGSRSRGAIRRRTAGKFGDAAQAQSRLKRTGLRACSRGARQFHRGPRECGAVARRDISHSSVERVILADSTICSITCCTA